MIVAQSKESKFFLSQKPVVWSQNLHPNNCMPSMLKIAKLKTGLSPIDKVFKCHLDKTYGVIVFYRQTPIQMEIGLVTTLSMSMKPEYEDEEGQKAKKNDNIVECPEHHHQLALEAWEEPDQLQDPEEPEGPEDTQTRALLRPVQETVEDLNTTIMERENLGEVLY